jgi:hypothetical protein
MRQYCDPKVTRNNTPLHALLVLNEPTYVEAARNMAQRLLEQDKLTTDQRLALAFRQTTGRLPSAEQQPLLRKAYNSFHAEYTADRAAAAKLLRVGESPRNERLDAIDHAALATMCHLLFNLDETLTRQ